MTGTTYNRAAVTRRQVLGDISNRSMAVPEPNQALKKNVKPSNVMQNPVNDMKRMNSKPTGFGVPSNISVNLRDNGMSLFNNKKSGDVPGLAGFSKMHLYPNHTDPPDAIDMMDISNAQAVVGYVKEIHEHYRDTEGRAAPSATYMTTQTDVNEKMRSILIDWLVEVHLKFKLIPETLYLTVHILDRFLALKSISRNKLQLVGATAMFIASKYEEIYAPEVRDFVYICDKAYTREDILKMEALILGTLDFTLTQPNVFVFMKRFCKVSGLGISGSKGEQLCNYLVELTLQEYKMLKYLPSTIAASACYLALKMTGQRPWTSELQQQAGYTENALHPCLQDMNALLKAAPSSTLSAVRKKYAHEKYGAVSHTAPVEI